MPQTFTNEGVCHAWAHRRQPSGRSSISRETGSPFIFFEGPVIYSYGHHFPMARHLPDGSIAITTDTYSRTTAGHISKVRRSIPGSKQTWYVSNPTRRPDAEMRAEVEAEILESLRSSSRARSQRMRLDHVANALHLAQQFNGYALANGLSTADCIDTMRLNIGDIDRLNEVLRGIEAERAAAEKASAERFAAKHAEAIDSWRNHGGTRGWDIGKVTLLRISLSGQHIETSRGAEIPVADASRLWPAIQRCMQGNRDYEVGMQLGHYQLTKIRTDGSIVVGCHDIAFAEIERIAMKLGLVPSEVPA